MREVNVEKMNTPKYHYKEQLGVVRFILVLAGCSPLFVLWAIRGTSFLSDYYIWGICLLFIIAPNGYLFYRIHVAKCNNDTERITIKNASDHTDSLLVYLLAMLLPLYSINLSNVRELIAGACAFLFIVYLFFYMHMHYMNIVFAIFRYRIFTVTVNLSTFGDVKNVVITKRPILTEGIELNCLRLSNTVYVEMDNED